MTSVDIVYDVDGLLLYQGAVSADVDGVEWIVYDSEGWWTSAPVRTEDTPIPAGDGSYAGVVYSGARVITLTGFAVAPTFELGDKARHRFDAHLRGKSMRPLIVYEPVTPKRARVNLANSWSRPKTLLEFDFELTVTAPDPLKYAAAPLSVSTPLAQSAFGGVRWGGIAGATGTEWMGTPGIATTPTGVLWQASSGETGTRVLTNPGTAPAGIVITIAGPVSAPQIVDLSTGATIRYGGDVLAGQTLVIDTLTESVQLDGADRSASITRFDSITVPAMGSTELAFRSDTSSPTALLTVAWYPAWY